jgi:DNA replication licensing factor MCM7
MRQINYPEELNRIEDFLTRFVADSSARRRQLPDDDDQEAEEEDQEDADMLADAVDDLDVNGEERSKAKYMRVLRKVANRQSAAVVIDLNDVKEVRYCLTWIMMRGADM